MAKTRSSTGISNHSSSEPPTKKVKITTMRMAEVEIGSSTRPARKRQAAPEALDDSDLPKRISSAWKVGAHVSAAGGVENAILNAAKIGGNAFALFLKSQRKWTSPPLTAASISSFKAHMEQYEYPSSLVLPHGSYLINLGNIDVAKREKSYECFLDDLKRCEQLGLTLYNFHPGSTVGATTTEKSISLIAECINRAHKETEMVTAVLENMAGAGNVVGGDFAHLAAIIAQVEDKTRVGVCLDTCHMFAAGYDIRKKEDWDATLKKFDDQIGLSYLRGMHLNDSKTPHNSKKDRHESIGLGHIGIHAFHHIMNDPRVQNIPLILETPSFELPAQTWAREIHVLNQLSGLTLEDDSVTRCEDLASEIKATVGAAEKAGGKKSKPKPKGTGRKRKSIDDDGDSDSDDEHEHEH